MKITHSLRALKHLSGQSTMLSVTLLVIVSGCAHVAAPPVEQMAVSRAAVERVSSSPNGAPHCWTITLGFESLIDLRGYQPPTWPRERPQSNMGIHGQPCHHDRDVF